MKIWFCRWVLFWNLVGVAGAQTAAVWKGVVMIAGGQVQGAWSPPEMKPPAPDQWERWEQMEKLSAPETLRRSAPPTALLLPDSGGLSVLAVAPNSGLSGHVVDAGRGMVDIRGAAVKNLVVRVAEGGQLMIKDSQLTDFHVVESAGALPGGSVVVEGCAVTGSFGGIFWGGSQKWTLRGCQFRESQLPWVNARAAVLPAVENCHFEKCFVPESFLLRCRNCTFDGCVIGRPEFSASGGAKTFELWETGNVNTLLARGNAPVVISVLAKPAPAVPFWGTWRKGTGTASLECQMTLGLLVKPLMLSDGEEPVESVAVGTKGQVYRRLDGVERLLFAGTMVNVLENGEVKNSPSFSAQPGRQVEWSQESRPFLSVDSMGKVLEVKGPVTRKGYFSPDYAWLMVLDEVQGAAPDLVRIFQCLPEALPLAKELGTRGVGTTWALEGPEKCWLRFETPTQLLWMTESGKRGSSAWRSFKEDGSRLMVADWMGAPAVLKLTNTLSTLTVTAGPDLYKGTFVRREPAHDFSPLMPGAGVAPVTEASASTTSAKTGPTPSRPSGSAVPSAGGAALKGKTSRINGLLVSVLSGGRTAGATSQMNIVALPSGGSGDASLEFNQKIGSQMSKALAEVKKFQTIRQNGWPQGYSMEISFADKYIPKDGPSAAVACALLLEGLFTGTDWDLAMAVTGDLNADGSVQPVGGVPAKIRGAVSRKCRMVGVPAANERAVRDYFLSEGPQSLLGINVLALSEFAQARDLALVQKPAPLATALTEFDKITSAAPEKSAVASWLKLPAVAAQLRKVLASAPHHLSAKLLLEFSQTTTPMVLSLAGSLETIDREAHALLQAIRTSDSGSGLSGIRHDALGDAVFRLRRIRALLHPETRRLLDSMEAFSTTVRTILTNPPRTPKFASQAQEQVRRTAALVDEHYDKLRNDPEVVAELMRE